MTLATRRRRGGELVRCEPSRFLEWEGKGIEVSPEERQERGKAHLIALKGMLGG